MKKLILLAVMCLVYHTLFADETTPKPQSDAHLYGHVIDSETGEHLPYVTVTIPGTTIGTATDASGHYFLKNLPTGTIKDRFVRNIIHKIKRDLNSCQKENSHS